MFLLKVAGFGEGRCLHSGRGPIHVNQAAVLLQQDSDVYAGHQGFTGIHVTGWAGDIGMSFEANEGKCRPTTMRKEPGLV